MNTKFLLLFALLFFAYHEIQSQNFGSCGYEEEENRYTESSRWANSSDTWLEYRTPAHWIPNNSTPIKTILVNWIICRNDEGLNGWQDTIAFRNQVELMFDNINQWYSNSLPKGYSLTCEPTYNHIYDTRIRFELNDIIFLNNTSFNESCSGHEIIRYVHENYPESRNVLNHIFTMPPEPCSQNHVWGMYIANSENPYVITYYSMFSDWYVVWNDHIEHIAHEYGHVVGQNHTYNSEQRCTSHYDFLDDVFGNCAEESCGPCNPPSSCDGDFVCYLTKSCFWENQNPPFPLMSGNNINSRYISPKSAGRMHRALSLYDNSFSVNNKAIHKYVKEKYSYCIPMIISNNETWDFAIKMYQDIVIETGCTLTIKGEVKMPIDGKIIVKPGAKLILDNAILTSAHSESWQGIEVWGNSNAPQATVNGQCAQGCLELKNGAVIENAVCAVELWKPEDWSTTGGIIHATNAVFRNNAKSIHALHFQNVLPTNGRVTTYDSYFRNCTFTIDEDYLGDETFYKHVDLDYVNGISFRGCEFSVVNTTGVSPWNSGIAAYNAGFSVDGLCLDNLYVPCQDYKNSSFSNFFTAVSVLNNGSCLYPVTVRHSDFNMNNFGVFASNAGYATLVQNEFNIGSPFYWECKAGIWQKNGNGIEIEENSFAKAGTDNRNRYGIIMENSGTASLIYRNSFENLYCGNLAIGKNWSSSINEGVEYRCNENTGNNIDFYVLGNTNTSSRLANGIQSFQGDASTAAGNTFSGNGYHFYNGGDYRVSYYYHGQTGQVPTTVHNTDLFQAQKENDCPPNFDGGDIRLTQQQRQQRESDFLAAYNAYETLKETYERNVDGGNTSGSLADIQSANPSDMMTLRTRLLGDSPYVSQEVLMGASDRTDVFPDGVLFEILSANPDELKQDTLISYLENKENPMPQYMVSVLRQVASGATAKTALLSQMAQCRQQYTIAANDIIRDILNDSIIDNDDLRGWLANLNDMEADRDIIATYVSEGDFENALTLANALPGIYGLQGSEIDENNDYIALITLYRNLHLDGRNITQLIDDETLLVERIAHEGTGRSQVMANNISDAASSTASYDCPSVSTSQDSRGAKASIEKESLNEALGMTVTATPNPASNWVAFDYTLPVGTQDALITINDMLGRTVKTINIDAKLQQKVVDLRDIPNGIYSYTLRCGELVQTNKIVINR